MKILISILMGLVIGMHSIQSQSLEETPPPNYIRSILFGSSGHFSGTPVIQTGEGLVLEFDDIIGDEANYYYTLKHFDYDWTPSPLVKSEYLQGFDNVRIREYQNSFNTLQLYSHYRLRIPNAQTRGFKVTGNYLLSIFNEARELVFSRKFMVYQPLTQVAVEIKKSRDVRFIHSRQVVNFKVSAPDFVIRNPESAVHAVVLQNRNLKTGIYNIPPQYHLGNELIFKYDQRTSFPAGNEYLNFDSKDLRAATVDIQFVVVKNLYHHYLFADRVRAWQPYTYNPDVNGQFVIRTMQGQEPDVEAGYVWTHFFLNTPDPLPGGEVHLYGGFNNFELDASTRLKFDPVLEAYTGARLFKQGYYDYKYVLRREDGSVDTGAISGDHISTENEYTVLIYYLPPGARFARIIGTGSANSTEITN